MVTLRKSEAHKTLTFGGDFVNQRALSLAPDQACQFVDGRVAGHLGDAVGLKTFSIHVCICPHFGM